jgi:maltooligosyltrehalose trehalohydrolase
MKEIRLWAPAVRKVELVWGGSRQVMVEENQGWRVLDGGLDHGEDYSFLVDGEGPFPDPRSPWQPAGVHGPSRRLDHAKFTWSDLGWQAPPLAAAVIYELHVGTFSPEGTFDGAISRLDHLVELGVTHVEIMPVAEFSGSRGWGYDGVALYAPHHAYGGPDGLKRLVDACHARGLAAILDVVYNHLGPEGNYLAKFGHYFTARHMTPWGEAVNFDGPESDHVRRFFLDNALMWLRDYHFDGLRIDAVHTIIDNSAIHFLEQIATEVADLQAEIGRHLVLIVENDLNDSRMVRPPEVGGYGIDAQWNEDFHHALHSVLTGERDGYYRDFGRVGDLARVITRGLCYDGRYSEYRRRRHGRSAADLSAHRFVGCLQNHDQVGNRAAGDRTHHLLTQGELKIGAALVLTSPFIPMLFQGEEWGASAPFLYFTDHEDRDLGNAVREGRRKEFAAFGWNPEAVPDPQDADTFRRSILDWEERATEPHASLLCWHRELIALRRRFSALTDGRFDAVEVRFDEEERWMIIFRGPIAIACNFSPAPKNIPIPESPRRSILLCSDPGRTRSSGALYLPEHSAAVLGPS